MLRKSLALIGASLGFSGSSVMADTITTPKTIHKPAAIHHGAKSTNKINKSVAFARSKTDAKRWPNPPTKAKFKQNQRKQRAAAARKKAKR